MERLKILVPLVKPYYPCSDPAHDWAHIGRVAATARILAAQEKIDLECVLAAVYCHDLINLPKNHPDRKNASTLSANEAEPLLKKAGFTSDEIKSISQAIIEHSFSHGTVPSNSLAAIVQDADRLDALGAIGILRCAAVNTQLKARFYDPLDPLAREREPDDKNFMLDYYFVKLFKLPEMMNTEAGKILARERIETMKGFIDKLIQEIMPLP